VAAFHGVENPVVLETDPVKMKSPLLPLLPFILMFLFMVMILAEMGESPFPDLMFL
jgi:hypothetical protein